MVSNASKACALVGIGFLIKGCGPTVENTYYRTEPQKATFEEVEHLVHDYCYGCHNGTTHPLEFKDEGIWKRSRAKDRIEAGTMPPGGDLPVGVREKLLSSF